MSLTLVQSRWQGWVLRSRCCRRHHRKIQTIARLSTPVVITSALFVKPGSRDRCEEHRERPDERAVRRRGSLENNETRRPRGSRCRYHRVRLRATRSCEKRLPGRRWRPSATDPFCTRKDSSRHKREFVSHDDLRARRNLLSFLLSLPSEVSYDLILPLASPYFSCCTI